MSLLSSTLRQRVQTFLVANGVPPEADISGNTQQIFAMLQRRRKDDAFWTPLVELLRDLVNSVVHDKVAKVPMRPEVALLAMWNVDDLAALLREALSGPSGMAPVPSDGPVHERQRGFMRSLSTNAFGLFLLLSLAASACNSSDTESQTGSGDTAVGGGAGKAGGSASSGGSAGLTTSRNCQRDVAAVVDYDTAQPLPANCCADTASQLWKAIDDSTLSSANKQELYTCFANLHATWCDGLVRMFRDESPYKVAEYLKNLLSQCNTDRGRLESTFSECVVDRMLCAVPLYKGVAFPR